MFTLGISEIDNDAGVVLIEDADVVCGVNEERFSRVKRHRGFPHQSVSWVLDYAGISIKDVDYVAIAKADPATSPERFYRFEKYLTQYPYLNNSDPSGFLSKLQNAIINRYRNIPRYKNLAIEMSEEIRKWIADSGCESKVRRVHHHYAHAACAYWASGFQDAIAVTIDGQGEGATSEVYLVKNGSFSLLKEILVPNSLGQFYASVTKALGYRPARHEGKITGLAAFGDPSPDLIEEVRKLAYFTEDGSFNAPCIYGNYPRIIRLAKIHGPENISAAFQIVLDEVVERYVRYYIEKTGIRNVVLAGGVTANVKMNQEIHKIESLDNIFIFPHMADGGLGYGAAQAIYRTESGNLQRSPIKDVYWGPEYTEGEVQKAIEQHQLEFVKSQRPAEDIAERLANGEVVAHFNGRMEFGPRALGNRSILYTTTDPSVNDWLNTKLHRSEFMPFAPVTLRDQASECYIGIEGAETACEYMTVTMDCTKKMKEQSPAVVHVDGTARPQIISEKSNLRYFEILSNYHARTGIPSLINTSFNMHEEPIVCSPDDAIRAFIQSDLHCLAMGDLLVTKR